MLLGVVFAVGREGAGHERLADVVFCTGHHVDHVCVAHKIRIVVFGCEGHVAVVVALAVETLPRVTCHYVEVRLDGLEFLVVVEVELEKGVRCELVCVFAVAAAELLVAVLPCDTGVGFHTVGLVGLGHVVTEVEVGVEFRKEVERVVELQVAVASVHIGVVVALHEVRHRVDVGVVHEGDTLLVMLLVGLCVLVVSVPEILLSGVACSGDPAAHGLCGVVGDGVVDGALVAEVVADVISFGGGVDLQVLVKELGREVESECHTVHLGSLDDTVGVGVAEVHVIRQYACCTSHTQVVVGAYCGAEHFVLPVGVGLAEEGADGRSLFGACDDSLTELLGAHCLIFLAWCVHIHVGREVHLGLAALAFLGSNDDHTVGRARTVDGGCRSVLEHCHALDILRRNHTEGVAHTLHSVVAQGHTVDHDKWVVGCVER